MEIETTHHVDAGGTGAKGKYGYHYEYDLYRFSDGGTAVVARSYKDEPQAAHFLRIERNGKGESLNVEDLQHPLLLEALSYLKGIGKQKLSWLSGQAGGYEPILPSTSPNAEG
jgi:hypothetical protein